MKSQKAITNLILCLAVLSLIASLTGILSSGGPGQYEFRSLHGETVMIYGRGVYQYNSVIMAVQGIAHDVVTLFLGIPLLLISLWLANKGLLKGRLLLAGTLAYFLVTYSFYLVLPTYSQLYLLWIATASVSFFAFVLTLLSFDVESLRECFTPKLPHKFIGGFLVVQALFVGLLWLSRLVPPLIRSIVPGEILEHYATLPVQGFDLAFYLPLAVVSGGLLIKQRPWGYLMGSTFVNFLILLMPALVGKIIAQGLVREEDMLPPLIIMSLMGLLAITCAVLIFKNTNEGKFQLKKSTGITS